jgi:hypothetical protein
MGGMQVRASVGMHHPHADERPPGQARPGAQRDASGLLEALTGGSRRRGCVPSEAR